MKIYLKSLVMVAMTFFFAAQTSFACVIAGAESVSGGSFFSDIITVPANPVDGNDVNIRKLLDYLSFWFVLILFLLNVPGIFSPIALYFWYIGRGGKKKWLVLPALLLLTLFVVGIFSPMDFWGRGFFMTFALFYAFFAPIASYKIHIKQGGKEKWFYWMANATILLVIAWLLRGIFGLTMCISA